MIKMTKFIPFVVGALFMSQAVANASADKLPTREDIPTEFKWNLADIYATEDAWLSDFNQLKISLKEISKFSGKLTTSPENILNCLQLRDQIAITSGKLYGYARMHRDENSASSHYQALTGKVEALLADAGASTAFIEPEILSMSEKKLKSLRTEASLKEYSFYFENLLRQKKHILSQSEEELLSRSAEMAQASENTFNMLAHADMQFPKIKDENDNMVELSEGRYRAFIMSPNRDVRLEAFKGLFNTYNQYRNTFAATLGGNVKKNIFYAKVRKYDSTLDAALQTDNVPKDVYENLINTVHNNLEPLHKYVALKKKALNIEEIHAYDLYVPLVHPTGFDIKYEAGSEIVKKSLAPLGEDYQKALELSLTSRWIDVYENKGKQTGAYAWGIHDVHPYVLLNYNNRYDDVSTLAHELGHALHSYYSQKNQPYPTASYTTFTAEVASTTNEILLMDYMLNTTTDKMQKLYLINQYLEGIRTTLYRQTMFAEFEKIIYDQVEQGETLTADGLDSIWHELNVKYYGPEIIIDKELDSEWSRIPHFYYNFYVYQYVTGYSAATALAHQIQTEKIPAQERYLNFLKSGGSDYPINILKRAGVDMSSPKPIELTLNKFSKLVTEMEQLLNEVNN